MITFTVHGNPRPQGRPRFARMGKFVRTYDSKEDVDFKNRVAQCFKATGEEPLFYPLTLEVDFYVHRPTNLMRNKDSAERIACFKKPDIDNLLKAIMDGLNGLAWRDDGQVYSVKMQKWYHEKAGVPRTEIKIF